MDGFRNLLAQTFGPMIQFFYFFFILFLAAWCIGAITYWCEQKLMRTKNGVLGILPFPILAIGILYGGMRFSGQLLYPEDGWDQWGDWNYTHQNGGAFILFICGSMLIGAALAMRKRKIS